MPPFFVLREKGIVLLLDHMYNNTKPFLRVCKKVRVVIVGSTGYGGVELIRLCERHPRLELGALVSTSAAEEPLSSVYPHLSHLQMTFSELSIDHIVASGDVVFFATPAGVSSEWIPQLVERGMVCIDLSGDFRLTDPNEYEAWYGRKAADVTYLEKAVYGLSEWHEAAIREAAFIANPGCYPTAALLGLLPLLKRHFIDPQSVIIDAKSGVSGAGRSSNVSLSFTEVNENFRPYKVGVHQHIPEIERYCRQFADQELRVSFTPHLVPMSRGICCTMYGTLSSEITAEDIAALYRAQYEEAPFVRLRSDGTWPQTKDVTGSNYCDIAFHVDERTGRVIIVSVIDNLVKGAAGQAVQNLNIRMGWPQTLGLEGTPLYP